MNDEPSHHKNLSDQERASISEYLAKPGVSDRRLQFRFYKVLLIGLIPFLVALLIGWSVEYFLDW